MPHPRLIAVLALLPAVLEAAAVRPLLGFCGHPAFQATQETLVGLLLSGRTSSEELLGRFLLPYPEVGLRIDHPKVREAWLAALRTSDDPLILCKGLAYLAEFPDPPADSGPVLRLLSHPDTEVRAMAGLVTCVFPGLLPFSTLSNRTLSETDPAVLEVLRKAMDYVRSGRAPRRVDPFRQERDGLRVVPWTKHGQAAIGPSPGHSVFAVEAEPPEVSLLVHPVLRYREELVFETPRRSFGVGTANIHVGDDCAWFRDGTPVFSVAEGLVRLVWWSPDWGHLVLIEHRRGEERFCSLYGHLGAAVFVRAGDRVRAGELIGKTGWSYSAENGGYGSHLHFAVAEGPWLKSRFRPGQLVTVQGLDGPETVRIVATNAGRVEVMTRRGPAFFDRPAESLNDLLQWVKGYQPAELGTSGWLDPQTFLP